MRNKYILALAVLLFGLPLLSNPVKSDPVEPEQVYYSTFEQVLNMTGNYSWTVTESQVLLKGLVGAELETALSQWNDGTNIQKASKIEIKGSTAKSYESIYFKPCQDLVMEKIEGSEHEYTDNFRMKGIVVGTYTDQSGNQKPQVFSAKNVTFTSFINGLTNDGGDITITATDFIKNKSETNGAAIYNESGKVTITGGSNLYYNLATDKGGAVYNSDKGTLIVRDSVIGGQHNEGIYYICSSDDPVYHTMSADGAGHITSVSDEESLGAIHSLPNSDVTRLTYNVDGLLGSDDWIILYYLVPEWRETRGINWPEEDAAGTFNSRWVHIYPLGNEAKYGAGIYNEGNATITGTTFKYNIAKKRY